jgi:hypothetical protein
MVPGLWLEPEVAGIHSQLRDKPDDWFFRRHGKRVVENSRFFLDLQNREVRAYLDGVVDRLVTEFDIGYIKTDYNVDAMEGTEWQADSFGRICLACSWLIEGRKFVDFPMFSQCFQNYSAPKSLDGEAYAG